MKFFYTYRQIECLKLIFPSVFFTLSFSFFSNSVSAQIDTNEKVYQGMMLDEVMIKAVADGFDVSGFIQKVKQDTTFYKAFKTLRLLTFNMYNDIEIDSKDQDTKASYNSLTRQEFKNSCRTMNVLNEKVTGDFYTKKRDYNYYTAKLYAHLFFTQGQICNENNVIRNTKNTGSSKYEEQLRMLIFNPGQKISGIPGIGENVAIFDEPYYSKYQFHLSRSNYNGEDCYIFKAKPKAGFTDDVVINELKTWFRVSDFAIVARDYALSFKTLFYDFDVVMNVKLKMVKGQLVPYEIHYKGNWHVVFKPREIATFTAIFTDFE